MANFSLYSLKDVVCTFISPDVGNMVISDQEAGNGSGRIVISYAGDLFSNTRTANGYVTINRMNVVDGQVALEIPVNSPSDFHLRKWIRFLKTCKTQDSGNTSLSVYDPVRGVTMTMIGVVPTKAPDENFDQTAGNKQYNLLFAQLTESEGEA